jgi:hypothetical protein
MNPNANTRNRPKDGRNARQASPQSASGNQSQWQRKYEHYCSLAQAANGDDDVARQQHWQHAEHYRRLLNGSAN